MRGVVRADEIAHEAYRKGSDCWHRIVELFGPGVLDGEGAVDRAALGQRVFGSPEALAQLNAVVHPAARQLTEGRLRELEGEGCPVSVLEAPLLFEAGWEDLADEVWVVRAPPRTAIRRLEQGRKMTEEEARARIHAQSSNDWKAAQADVIIDNSGTREELRERIIRLWHERALVKG